MKQYTSRHGKKNEVKRRMMVASSTTYDILMTGRHLIVDAIMTPGGVKLGKRLRGVRV